MMFPHQLSTTGISAVAGGLDIIEFQREVQLRQQLAGKHHTAIHDAQQDRGFSGEPAV